MSVDLTTPCADCGLPLEAHVREGRIVACRGARIPAVLTIRQLAKLIGVSVRTLHKLRHAHSHPAIQELPNLASGHPRFSGPAVQRWIDGTTNLRLARRRA